MRTLTLAFMLTGLLSTAAWAGTDEQTGVPTAQPEKVGMSSDRLERLSSVMQGYIDDNLLAGTVTLVARKGKVVHFEAQGFRDIEANDPMGKDSIFVMMSMTKPIVSVALMMLYEEGHFLLDDPITNWIHELGGQVSFRSGISVERSVVARLFWNLQLPNPPLGS